MHLSNRSSVILAASACCWTAYWIITFKRLSSTGTAHPSHLQALSCVMMVPDYESLFYRINIVDELEKCTEGDPFRPLLGYKNPCWFRARAGRSTKTDRTKKHRKATKLRCFPYAMLIGVSKSGTTDLYYRLTKHPQIYPPERKEIRFWNRQRIGSLKFSANKRMTFTKFLNFFDEASKGIQAYTEIENGKLVHPGITLEATPHYLWDYDGWQNIPANVGLSEPRLILAHTLHEIQPKLKLLVILRNPVDRLFSQFHMLSPGRSPAVFHYLVKDALRRWRSCLKLHTERACAYNGSLIPQEYTKPGGITLRAGMYSVFLRDWLSVYPSSQFHIIKSENYYENISSTLINIFRFLGIKTLTNTQQESLESGGIKKASKSKSTEPMYSETRRLLEEFYRPFNRDLATLLDNIDFLWH